MLGKSIDELFIIGISYSLLMLNKLYRTTSDSSLPIRRAILLKIRAISLKFRAQTGCSFVSLRKARPVYALDDSRISPSGSTGRRVIAQQEIRAMNEASVNEIE